MRPAFYNLLANKIPETDFEAPLIKGLELRRGVGSATFTRASTATVFGYAPDAMPGDAQIMLTVNSNEARFEGARRVENLVSYSEDFSNAAWTKIAATITADSTVAPDGKSAADKLVEDTSNSNHGIINGAVTSGQTYTVSIYAKSAGGNKRYLYIGGLGLLGAGEFVYFDLENGTINKVGAGTSATYSIKSVGNGWYRCSITFTATNTSGTSYGISDNNTYVTNPPSYTGDGTSGIYLWGAQLEQASFASSYIPTTSASVTRNADVLTYPAARNFRDSEGVAYAEVIAESWSNATGQYLGDNSGSPLRSSASNSGVLVYDGTNTANGPSGSPSGQMKVSSSWRDILKAFANGNKGTDASYDKSFGLSQLAIGDSFFGTLRNLKIWKKTLSDRQLLEITK